MMATSSTVSAEEKQQSDPYQMIHAGGGDVGRKSLENGGGKVHRVSDSKRRNAAPASGTEKASSSAVGPLPYSNVGRCTGGHLQQ